MTTRNEYIQWIAGLRPYRSNGGAMVWRLARMPQFSGSPWCGATRVAADLACGIDFTSWITAREYIYVPDIISQARGHGMWQPSVKSKPGDAVTILGGQHVGTVWANDPNLPYIHTIDGNTSDGVHGNLERGIFVRTRYRSIIDGTVDYSRFFSDTRSKAPARGRLAVDGIAGPATVRELQRLARTPQDGTISTQPVKHAARLYAWTTVQYVRASAERPSPLVRWLQRTCGDTPDGYFGPSTARALQKRLGVKQDSIPGPVTVRALQTRLNAGSFA